MSTMEKPRDVVGGLVVMTIGTGFLMFGRELEMGTSFRMGPGYFPTILSIVMIALGAVIALQGLRAPLQEQLRLDPLARARPHHRSAARLRRNLGRAWISPRRADGRARHSLGQPLRQPAQLGRRCPFGLAAFCALLFIRLLGLPLPLTGPWLSADYWSPASMEVPAPAAPAEPQ